MLKQFGTPELALSAYNSGPGGSEASGRIEGYEETQRYVNKVMKLMQSYSKFDTGGNVGSMPLGGKKGPKMKAVTSFIDAPPDIGLRANLGPLSRRAVADIQRRASRSMLVAQPLSTDQLNNSPALQAAGKMGGVPVYIDYGAPLGAKWTSGGGVHAHHARAIGNWQSDNAVDLMAPVGTPVYAMIDGVIGDRFGPLNSSDPRMAGLRLNLHGKGNDLYYAHLSAFAPGIKPGTRVKKGQLLGFSGTANGAAHLHLGMRVGNPDYLLDWWDRSHPRPGGKKPKKPKKPKKGR
jgi:murein DD-endopeptidase MepM/ murein hydrolase activator NlpD